ncbi:MAG: hypothetical protein AAF430_21930 [Myxococcota bacterium]
MFTCTRLVPRRVLGAFSILWLALCLIPLRGAAELWTLNSIITDINTPHPAVSLGQSVLVQVEIDPSQPDMDPGNPNNGAYSFDDFTVFFFGNNGPNLSQGISLFASLAVVDDQSIPGSMLRDQLYGLGYIRMPSLSAAPFDEMLAQFFLTEDDTVAPTVLLDDGIPDPVTPPLGDFTTNRTITFLGNGYAFLATVTAFGNAGASPPTPVLPTSMVTNANGTITWIFANGAELCVSGCWVDPPIATSYTYAVTSGGLFHAINDFPTGFSPDFEVSVGGSSLGTFGPGDSVDFTTFPGGGVTSFEVSGISPGVDAEDPAAFPLQVTLDSSTTAFSMTSGPASVPVPMLGFLGRALAVATLVLAGSAGIAWRRSRG